MPAAHRPNEPNAEAEIRELLESRTRALALKITADADLAFCHFLVRISGTMLDDTVVSMWVRATSCLRKRDDGWKIVHEHASVPFDAQTGKAVVTGDLSRE